METQKGSEEENLKEDQMAVDGSFVGNENVVGEDEEVKAARLASNALNQMALLADMERKYVQIRKERDSLSSTCSLQQNQLTSLQTEFSNFQKQNLIKDTELQSTKAQLESLQTSEIHSQERVDRMNVEADALREEISRLKKMNQDMATEFSEVQTKASLSSNSAAPLQYQVSRQQMEIDSLTTHCQWLEQQLTSSNDQLYNFKTKNSKTILELKRDIDTAQQEKDEAKVQLSSVDHQYKTISSKLDLVQSQMRDVKKEHSEVVESLQEELDVERRLTALTKEQVTRMEHKYSDAVRQLESMKVLAQRASNSTQTRFLELQTKMEQKSNQVLKDAQKRHEESTQALMQDLERVTEEKYKLEDSLLQSRQQTANNRPMLTLPSSGSSEPLGLTDLYTKLANTEEELRAIQHEKKTLEVYLHRVQMDIEAKAPILRQQRREYEVAMGQNQEIKIRLKEALQESQAARNQCQQIESEANEYQKECRELRGENTDLAKQIQALLRQEADNKGLVEFASIEEMQSQNQRLLQEHRRLSDTIQEMQQRVDTDNIQISYREAQEELRQLREERERQATLVAGIVQQRDLYRALLAKTDSKLLESASEGGNELLSLKQQTDKWTEIKTENEQLVQKITKLEASLVTEENLKVGLEERLVRTDSHLTEITSTVDKLQRELSLAHGAKARSEADTTFYNEKCSRLDDIIEKQKGELSVLTQKSRDLERLNEGLQLSLTETRSDSVKFEYNNQMLEGKLRLAETQLKTAQLAEKRLADEANSLRDELSKQGSFLQSMQNIEATLSAHATEERERLENDLKDIKSILTDERTKFKIDSENLQNKISDLEMEVKKFMKEKEDGLKILADLKSKSADDAVSAKVLTEKCSTLEQQLNLAKIRLGDPDVDLSGEDKLASVSLELESTKKQLVATNAKVSSYEELAKTTEIQLKELTETTNKYREENDSEKENLKAELSRALKTAEMKQEALEGISKDLDASREEQEKVSRELKSKLAGVKTDLELAVNDKEASDSRVKILTEEITYYKADAKAATDNYERELTLHATARDSLRMLRTELENIALLRENAQKQYDNIKSNVEKERCDWQNEKEKLEISLNIAEERLKESKDQNKILHSQISSLSETVDKYQSKKLIQADISLDSKDNDEEPNHNDELSSLRKSVSELREMVRYMKTEREMNESQLDSARRTIDRERSAAEITKRSLDEVRAELEHLQKSSEESGNNISVPNHVDRLKQAEEQLILLRESNKLLREESDSIRLELQKSKQEAEETKASFEPTEKKCHNLEVSYASLSAEKLSLVREVDAWKSRVQSLISKFHQIDPDDHKKALAKVEEISKQYQALKIAKDQSDKECMGAKGVVSKLNKDISNLKSSCEAIKRELMKETSEKESIAKSIKEKNSTIKKENDELKIKLEKTEFSLKSLQTESSGATRRMDNLTKMLRKYKQLVADLKSENQNLIDNEQEAQKSLAKEKRAFKILTEKNELQIKQSDANSRNQGPVMNEIESQVNAAKKDSDEQVNKQSPKQTAGKKDGSANNASDAIVDSSRSDNEPSTENIELPTVPSSGFNFAPSISVEKASNTSTEHKITSKVEIASSETQSKNTNTVSSSATMEEGQDSITAEVPVTTEKNLDQMGKEENLRAKLMKRKRQLDAIMKKKAEEKENIVQPQAKRIDSGEKNVEKDCSASSTEKSTVTKNTSETKQQSGDNVKKDQTTQMKIEKQTSSISTNLRTNNPSKKIDSKISIEPTVISKVSCSKGGETSQSKSETFLNLQPPGKGNAAPFVFGKSSNIQLPIPTAKVSTSPKIGIFGQNPFLKSNVDSNNDQNKKRSLFSEEEKVPSKVARTEETKTDKGLEKGKDSASAEEGEIIDC